MANLYVQFLIVQDIENEERIRRTRQIRRSLRDRNDPFTLSTVEFVSNFRLTQEAAIDLINDLDQYFIGRRRETRIPNYLRVLSALHFFACGSYQRNVGNSFLACMSQPMVSRNIRDVSQVLMQHRSRKWIRFPRNNMERQSSKNRFYQDHHLPDILGVVDGTHIAIIKPFENEEIYVNRKGYHSINVQIIYDSTIKIRSIIARWPGSTHDAFVWRNSTVGLAMRANYENGDHSSQIMGDSGYSCLPWLLVPLPHPRTESEQQFNISFKRARRCVERCIGILKGRFRCLLKDRTLHYTPRNAARIIMACAILHNIAIHYRIEEPQPVWDELDIELAIPPAPAAADIYYRQIGQQSRQRYIADNF